MLAKPSKCHTRVCLLDDKSVTLELKKRWSAGQTVRPFARADSFLRYAGIHRLAAVGSTDRQPFLFVRIRGHEARSVLSSAQPITLVNEQRSQRWRRGQIPTAPLAATGTMAVG